MSYQDMMDYGSINQILEHPDPFHMDPKESSKLRFDALKASFNHHFFNNPVYNDYCSDYGITPDMITSLEDVRLIPLVPADFFRDLSSTGHEEDVTIMASVPKEMIARNFTTSGTGGQPSIYPYDGRSLGVINQSNVVIFSEVGGIKEDDYVLFLTPSPDKADTGMVQGMYLTLTGLLKNPEKQIGFGIQDDKLHAQNVVNMLSNYDGGNRHLYGPPYAYKMVAEEMIDQGLEMNLDEDSKAFTTGGWKHHTGKKISKDDLNKQIKSTLGIRDYAIRDGLGLTDIMSILLECEKGYKHIPPWLDVTTRDLDDDLWQTLVNPGEEGLIAFMSPLIGSFPAGVVTGDVGILTVSYDEKCGCGRYGPTIEFKRRASDEDIPGCAPRQERLLKGIEERRE